MEINNQVEQRREDKIQKAVKRGDWEEVSRLLDQPYFNVLRRDRKKGLCSLNSTGLNGSGELIDIVSDNQTPLTILIKKEIMATIVKRLQELSEVDRVIFLERSIYETSYVALAKKFGISDKTVKRHYERVREMLKENLEKN
ncbi:sigma-70, region 4 [Streptococcus sp. AS20]|uniref:RNA polymerase sigma factor n=1 Tax=Streptococcus TaxID=1301 RepID=UPI0004452D28|nr:MULTISPECIES: sigma-70 family RNA polymerase sigma factor [Streptococcus]HEN8848215.1 sigma-70 family RNA polymerase sigma factor [Streptococcus agalactiae]EUB26236.1 sigma-70, region 4 [Streptococcus sp. AS20]MBF7076548.1 sigma-70 family RNA polymerase sigma factor [Streptococcus sp. HF-100]MBX9102356.1 sigma-70 family RNA polymerase sigma factor [Streptococcus anginosus]MDX5006299.1 sigma-70 family RNA polymerase sigma factor [Streptococcus anginosus]